MKGLFRVLPPFAPDYSGVCSAIFELGGIAVIYDAGGCTGTYTGYDEPRWYGSSSAIYCGVLREIDAVLGDDEAFLRKVQLLAKARKSRFLALIGSPGPMVIGTDYEALAGMITDRTGLPALAFDTDGIKLYDQGVSAALTALAQTFVAPPQSKNPRSVNLIGATPLDFGKGQLLNEMTDQLRTSGIDIQSTWVMGSSLDDIIQCADAALNVVVSWSGLAAARFLEQKFGMPYWVGLPLGEPQLTDLMNRFQNGATQKPVLRETQNAQTTLVIGEQVQSNTVRYRLESEFHFGPVVVASFFGMDPAIRREQDVTLKQEQDLTHLTREKRFDLIIGDPLYQDLIHRNQTTGTDSGRFVAVPHVALSSRLYWDRDMSLFGETGRVKEIENKKQVDMSIEDLYLQS